MQAPHSANPGQCMLVMRAAVVLRAGRAALQVGAFRKRLEKVVGDKHEEVMGRMGAIMATGAPARPLHSAHPPCIPVWRSKHTGLGLHVCYAQAIGLAAEAVLSGRAVLRRAPLRAGLLDAGGRNVTVGLRSASGYFRRTSCVGMMLFLQYWYWYPLSYCLSLALQPSALIGLNADLKLPKMQVRLLPTASSIFNGFPIRVAPRLSLGIGALKQQIVSVLWDTLARHFHIGGLG